MGNPLASVYGRKWRGGGEAKRRFQISPVDLYQEGGVGEVTENHNQIPPSDVYVFNGDKVVEAENGRRTHSNFKYHQQTYIKEGKKRQRGKSGQEAHANISVTSILQLVEWPREEMLPRGTFKYHK